VTAVTPLHSLEAGTAMKVADLVPEEDDGLWKVGDLAEVFLGTHNTVFDDEGKLVIDTDSTNMTFRDDDEVYIVQVDKDAEDEDNGLVYLICHNEDGSGEKLWVRSCDLSDPE